MRNNALARIQKYGALDFEALVEFVGDALKNAIKDKLGLYYLPENTNSNSFATPASNTNQNIPIAGVSPVAGVTPYTEPQQIATDPIAIPVESIQLFPSDSCCSCLESFNVVERVFLYPCGHDICKSCAYSWFFNPLSPHTTCPQCRAAVNLDKLSINIASAPSI
jgi:hypothetical protein